MFGWLTLMLQAAGSAAGRAGTEEPTSQTASQKGLSAKAVRIRTGTLACSLAAPQHRCSGGPVIQPAAAPLPHLSRGSRERS